METPLVSGLFENGFGPCHTLVDLPAGAVAKVVGFGRGLSLDRRVQLQAYGLVPGYRVKLLQHSPVIVVLVDNTELAMEDDVAGLVEIEV